MFNISYRTLLIVALLLSPSYAQSKLEYTAIQSTFLTAKDAIIYQEEDKVTIQTVGLEPGQQSGVTLSFDNLTDPEIEVTQLIDFNGLTVGLYPPKNMKPNDKGVYNILGKKGDRFGIRARTEDGLQQIYIEIEGETTDPDDPDDPDDPPTDSLTPADIQSIVAITSNAATTLNDPVTARYIKDALTELSLSEVIGEVQMKVVISTALVESLKDVNPPYKDWNGLFRAPLNAKLVELKDKISSTASLKAVIGAIIKGLN